MIRVMCSWCHSMVTLLVGPVYCPDCGHRAGVPRMECDCPQCRQRD